ncbi:response regulator [Oceanispirochaeta crateris]|uniref:Response regulator n=1 Tax=Oceanispirochaeta crateris TaxID=2518645 RepID=A0A5C1QI67_9SPIO|nr:response regulator [Oceanispirochaeta crateris]QEN06690.1 response regulator [Oceanispirochaeta crateris]
MKSGEILYHDIRSSLNGVICMGSLLKDTDLTNEQADLLKYMLLSAEKTLSLLNEQQKKIKTSKQDIPSHVSSPELTSFPDGSSAGRPLSILVAEDDEVNRLYLTTLLKREHWQIDEAANGVEALEFFTQKDYQVILMDVSMPLMDGIQLVQKIREDNSDIPVLAITAHGEVDLQEELLQAGMTEVLLKPIHDEYLLGRIKSLCF